MTHEERLTNTTYTMTRRELARIALRRGVSKRCPHCGEGSIFSGWARHLERCAVCGLVFERNPGDTWAFTIIGDRLPIAVIIVLIYAGVGRSHPLHGFGASVLLIALLVWTAPNRWGVGIALHYLSRVFWPDPADPVPVSPAAGDRPSVASVVVSEHTHRGEFLPLTPRKPCRRSCSC